MVLVRSQGCPGAAGSVRGSVRSRLHPGRGAWACKEESARAGSVCPDDAHARPDRKRLDDLQGQGQSHVQPDGAARTDRASVEPVHRDSRGHQHRRDGGLQSGVDQPRAPPRASSGGRRVRLRKACAHRGGRGSAARPRHRSDVLPDCHGSGFQRSLAARRARSHGSAGCVLPPAAAVRQCRGSRAVRPDRGGDLLSRAARLDGDCTPARCSRRVSGDAGRPG